MVRLEEKAQKFYQVKLEDLVLLEEEEGKIGGRMMNKKRKFGCIKHDPVSSKRWFFDK